MFGTVFLYSLIVVSIVICLIRGYMYVGDHFGAADESFIIFTRPVLPDAKVVLLSPDEFSDVKRDTCDSMSLTDGLKTAMIKDYTVALCFGSEHDDGREAIRLPMIYSELKMWYVFLRIEFIIVAIYMLILYVWTHEL